MLTGGQYKESLEDRRALGGWHQVTNLQPGGGLFAQRLVTRRHYDIDRARALALKAAGLSGA